MDEKDNIHTQDSQTGASEIDLVPKEPEKAEVGLSSRRDFAIAGVTGLAALAAGALFSAPVANAIEPAAIKSKILAQIKKDMESSNDPMLNALTFDRGTVVHSRFISIA